MKGAPRSKVFDDIYFSQDDGLAESQFVFLKGNNLPARWQTREIFTICETGFGTGLNFLMAWQAFENEPGQCKRLNFISFEQYPLSIDEIREALSPWGDVFGEKIDQYLQQYPLRIPGVHQMRVSEGIYLTLIFDDINEAIPKLSGAGVDAWFLDGFNPAKNPEMWTQNVFENMARLSRSDAQFATFTAAGFVKRGLQAAGFDVQKTQGFGRKRERLVGVLQIGTQDKEVNSIRSVAIIGAGLAGTSAAYWFKKQGVTPVIFEKGADVGMGASGNIRGMVNPRLSKLRTKESNYYMQAYAMAIREMRNISREHDIEFEPCGALHVMHNDDMRARYPSMVEQWGWHKDHAYLVDRDQASDIAGIEVEQGALYLPDAAGVNPYKLCKAYTADVEVRFNTTIDNITQNTQGQWNVGGQAFDAVILASAMGVHNIEQARNLCEKVDLYPVRGQISVVKPSDASEKIKTMMNYKGYMSPVINGVHVVGSTFKRHDMMLDVRDEDHKHVLQLTREAIPALNNCDLEIVSGRASHRVSTKHRFPLFQNVTHNMFVSTGHGSHGLVSSIQSSAIIHNQLCSGLKLYE